MSSLLKRLKHLIIPHYMSLIEGNTMGIEYDV